MSIASYSELQTAVANWLHRADLTSTIPDFIMLGEKRISREIRSPEMETAYTGTIASGVIAVPTDFLAWKSVYIDGAPVRILRVKPLDWLIENYPTRSAHAQPVFMARNGANFEFGPYADSAYTVKGTYYKRLDPVSTSWNSLATASPDLYLAAALAEAIPFVKRDDLMVWEGKFNAIKNAINGENAESEISGGAIRMAAG